MVYHVKEIFRTLQGEGAQAGRAAVFCRFAGCNLWSGREADRAAAQCSFCDTDFVGTDGNGGGQFATPQALAATIANLWGAARAHAYVVFTGGEPALQLDAALIDALHDQGFACAIETNGTVLLPPNLDWICLSPKAGTEIIVKRGDELKLVFPQDGLDPASFEGLAFSHFFLQPMAGARCGEHTAAAIAYCQAHPRWRLSLQTHKFIGLP